MFNPLTFLSSTLGGLQTYAIVGAVALVAGAAGGSYAGYRWEHGEVLKLQLADAQAVTAAVEAQRKSDGAQATVNLDAAVKEAQAQDALHVKTVTLTPRIPHYVTPAQDDRDCATVGFLRVLRAAGSGVDPETLQLAPGQSDDDCSALTLSSLAGVISEAFGVAGQNAEQLNALIAWIKANHQAQLEGTAK